MSVQTYERVCVRARAIGRTEFSQDANPSKAARRWLMSACSFIGISPNVRVSPLGTKTVFQLTLPCVMSPRGAGTMVPWSSPVRLCVVCVWFVCGLCVVCVWGVWGVCVWGVCVCILVAEDVLCVCLLYEALVRYCSWSGSMVSA